MITHFLMLARFGIIGVLAALTHYAIVILLFEHWHWGLALANFVAFAIAFWVSFFGHHHFTFHVKDLSYQATLPKFFLVAVFGFIFNEACLLTLHSLFQVSVSILVIIAIFLTAIFTFLLNRFFAFQH